MNEFDIAKELILEIETVFFGHTALIVGGAVRDHVLGVTPNDIDIATSVPVEKIEDMFECHNIGKNKTFGITVVNYKGYSYEVAQFRKESDYEDHRRPNNVEFVSDFYTDSCRRDFTINSLAMDYYGNIIDYHGGVTDIKSKIIRTVGDAKDRFNEDYLRMIRAIRLSAKLEFEIDDYVVLQIEKLGHNVEHIAKERIWDEIVKLSETNGFSDGIITMYELGILDYILPEISIMDKYKHYKKHHPEGKTVLDHVFSVLKQLDNKSSIVKLAGLFHDIGKPKAFSIDIDGKFNYINHEKIGADVFCSVADRLRIPKDIQKEISYVILNHMKFHNFVEMKMYKCYDLVKNKYFNTLYDVCYADDICRLYLFNREQWNIIDKKIVDVLVVVDEYEDLSEVVNGKFVMYILEYQESKQIGEIIEKTKKYIISHNIKHKTEYGYNNIVKFIKQFKQI